MFRRTAVLLLSTFTAACTGDSASPSGLGGAVPPAAFHAGDASPAVAHDLATLTRVTAPFHRAAAAAAAGWSTPVTGCMSLPGVGAMGVHIGNMAHIDSTVSVAEPELLVYEPQKNGSLRLVAVEYIVPLAMWPSEDPPQLFGQTFHRNETFGLWALHVWLWKHNPAGLFADWNPTVSCTWAQ